MGLAGTVSPNLTSLVRPWFRAYQSAKYGATLPYYRFKDRFRLNDLNDIYTAEYFQKRTEPPYDTGAKTAVQALQERFEPQSVFDVGCAVGVYLKYFQKHGIKVAGVEGASRAVDHALVGSVTHADLRDAPTIIDNHDLVLCTEVAEHLHPTYADGLVETIVSATADDGVIVFTAAPPGQFGTHHINLQRPQYWAGRFRQRGWEHRERESAVLAARIRKDSPKPLIMTKNLMVFRPAD